MASGKLSHLQVNVNGKNLPFYRDLFTFLGWDPIYIEDSVVSFSGQDGASLWFLAGANDAAHDYDGVGVNHIALAADTQAEVDGTVAYLEQQGIERLFDTPRHRPDFSHDEQSTYYQVMFASPDGLLFEHVYTGPKQG